MESLDHHITARNRYLKPLREEVTRLNELMEELLDYGRPQSLQFGDVSFLEVARAAVSQARASTTRNVEVRLECHDALPAVQADRRRLQQVLRIVIDNAIQHSPQGGEVQVRLGADGRDVVCEVLDNGPGFSDEDLSMVFTPFYSKRHGGTGLGLAIAEKLVIAHGGEITPGNRAEGGAGVTIRIPVGGEASSDLPPAVRILEAGSEQPETAG